ncbi:hypothetical protein F5Y01DRAFT_298824 [Xylaria sp. FL0043]|nr:hypothetical protein F5Y01DRAFT_298824 [Xylaria sp. FL0043]
MASSPTQGGVYVVSSVLVVASSACVVLRYKARRLRVAKWWVDDWLVLCALLLQWGLAIILIYGATQGTIGTHTKINPKTGAVIVTPHEDQISLFGAISAILTILALGTLKSSVVMFYRRIFVGDKFRRISSIILLLIILWTTAFFFATVFECNRHNLNLIWKSIKTFLGQCQKYKTIQLAHCASDVLTDLVVLSLPMPSIWRLNMAVRRKVLLSVIFFIGFISVAAGTARLVIVAEDIVETTAGARDVRGTETNVLVWAYVEVGVGIIAACLPTLNPLLETRSIESVVASVRSKVSLGSLAFGNSNDRSKGSDAVGGSSSLELFRVDPSNPGCPYSNVDSDSIQVAPQVPSV